LQQPHVISTKRLEADEPRLFILGVVVCHIELELLPLTALETAKQAGTSSALDRA
jgi:hypothetical protein